jgi:hypothetical protein
LTYPLTTVPYVALGRPEGKEWLEEEGRVQSYVVCKGEYLTRIANKFGFDPDVVWTSP